MKFRTQILASPDSPLAPSGGPNGVDPSDPRAVLTAMVAQRELSPASELEDSPEPAATADPESQADTTAADTTGEDNLTSETPPAGEDGATDPTEPEGETEEPTEVVDPNDAAEADIPKGAQARIDKLTAQKYQALEEVESLKAKVAELEAEQESLAVTSTATPATLPEAVAKLKTVAQVNERLKVVQSDLDALTDFLDENPGDGDAKYQIGGKEFSRAELVQRKAALRSEARALPQRSEAITFTAQFAQARQQATAALVKEFPVLSDPDNPVTKTARQLMQLPQFQRESNGDELAYLLARGYEVVTAERNRRKGAPGAPLVKRPTGKVPLGKPHVAANGGGRATNGEVNVRSALDRVSKEGSSESLAELLKATGR